MDPEMEEPRIDQPSSRNEPPYVEDRIVFEEMMPEVVKTKFIKYAAV